MSCRMIPNPKIAQPHRGNSANDVGQRVQFPASWVAWLAVGNCRKLTVAAIAALGMVAGCSGETAPSDRVPSISHISANYDAGEPTRHPSDPIHQPELGESGTPTHTPTEEQSPTPTPTKTTEPSKSSSPSSSASPSSSPGESPQSNPIAVLEDEAIELTNDERTQQGCKPLRPNERLHTAARSHSEDMAARDYFSHTSPDGDSPGDRAAAAGYDAWAGENIAMGYESAEDVVEGWMNSEGHRKNILNCDFRTIGVGLADSARGKYWTQSFGYE